MEVDNIPNIGAEDTIEAEPEKRIEFNITNKSKRQYARYVRKRTKNPKRSVVIALHVITNILFILYFVNIFTGVKVYFPGIEYMWALIMFIDGIFISMIKSEFEDELDYITHLYIEFDEENDYKPYLWFARFTKEKDTKTNSVKFKNLITNFIYLEDIQFVEYDKAYKCIRIHYSKNFVVFKDLDKALSDGVDDSDGLEMEDSEVIVFDCFDRSLLDELKRYGVKC